MDGLVFPVVILDESSQLLEPLGLLSYARFRCEKLIVVGDPMQLPPTLTSSYGTCMVFVPSLLLSHSHGYVPHLYQCETEGCESSYLDSDILKMSMPVFLHL